MTATTWSHLAYVVLSSILMDDTVCLMDDTVYLINDQKQSGLRPTPQTWVKS